MTSPTPKNLDRLAKAMMERHRVSYDRAKTMLGGLTLHLVADDEIRESAALQAAFLTAINTGKRAFRGGVTFEMPRAVDLRLPWPGDIVLNDVCVELGGDAGQAPQADTARTILFGQTPQDPGALRVVCDGWRGGVLPSTAKLNFQAAADFSLGGVFAGGLAVARSFLIAAQISSREVEESTGLSLWAPEVNWLTNGAAGPDLEELPSKLWLLGLGHLGQAYAWSLGLLPFNDPGEVMITLQDFDEAEEANWSAGLLCEPKSVGTLKTRLCAEWLEKRGFRTRLVERRFDESTKRADDEPRIALCGFDNARSRRLLEDAGFDLIVESGIGGTLDRFDRIVLHTFPGASTSAREEWAGDFQDVQTVDPALFGAAEDACGIVLQEIAGKAISSSFTGACASSMVLAEVIKAIHGGARREFLAVHLRDVEPPNSSGADDHYQLRVARNGNVKARRARA